MITFYAAVLVIGCTTILMTLALAGLLAWIEAA